MIHTFQRYIFIIFFLCVNCSHSFQNLEDLALEEYPFEFPNSTSSPVNNQTEDIISTTPIDYNWNLTISYTYVKNVLNLSIISDSHRSPYKYYIVELRIKGILNFLERAEVNAIQPKTTITFRKVQPYTKNTFTIFPYVQNGKSVNVIDRTMYLGGYKLDSLDCNSPYSKLSMIRDMKEKSIEVGILSMNNKSCFQKYYFFLTKKLLYDKKYCPDNNEILDQKTVPFDKRMFVTFKNLTFGNYCVAYEGIHEYCPNMKCLLSSSILEPFNVVDYQDITPLPSIQASSSSDYLIPLIVSMTVSIILITVLILIWKGVIHYRIIIDVIKRPYKEKQNNIKKAIAVEEESHKQLIVPILYAQDCEVQNNVAVALYNFIKECFDVKPIIDVKEIGHVNKGDVAWIENLIDYKCPMLTTSNKTEDNKKFIILETECAIKLYHSWQKKQILYYKKYNFLNEFFRRGLDHLLSNIKMHKMDYCHLFVVRFSYSPFEKMDIVPKKRFLIPDYLVELYNSIHNKQTDVTDQKTEDLLQEWEKKDSFNNLKLAVKKMEEYVAANPNYADDLFLSDVNDLKEVYVI